VLAIGFSVPYARSKWYVDHHAHAAAAFIFKAAHHASMAVNLNICTGTHNIARKQDREVDHGTHRNVSVHGEQDSVGRDVLGFRQAVAGLRFQFHGQMQRKTRSALHFRIVSVRRFLLRVRRQLLL
jgi:hypothetical protein